MGTKTNELFNVCDLKNILEEEGDLTKTLHRCIEKYFVDVIYRKHPETDGRAYCTDIKTIIRIVLKEKLGHNASKKIT